MYTQVEVSSAELVKSGIGKIITELRRSPEERISSRAQALRAKWKAIVVSLQYLQTTFSQCSAVNSGL